VLSKEYRFLSKGRQRAARSTSTGKIGRVDADLTYYGWLKNQPAKVQDSIIGKSRGKLLRNGGISSERFAELQLGKNFKPLNLKQMRELDPVAFEQAGLVKAIVRKSKTIKTPVLTLGGEARFDVYANSIKKDAIHVINALPKPLEILSKGGFSKGSYYSPDSTLTNGTTGTLVARKNGGKKALLHEYGHHIDYTSHELSGQGLVIQSSMDKEFLLARKADIAHIRDKFKGKNAYVELKARWKGNDTFNGVSDMFDSLTLGVFHDKYWMPGHGARYYNAKSGRKVASNVSNRMTESFAQMFEAWAMDGEAWQEVVLYFPNQAAAFIDKMESIRNAK